MTGWLDRKPDRWGLLNAVMLTVILVLLGPGSWLGRILGYAALVIVAAWRANLEWRQARARGLGLGAALMGGATTVGYLVICAATVVFGLEYAHGVEASLAFVLFGFQLYFFRLFAEPEGPAH